MRRRWRTVMVRRRYLRLNFGGRSKWKFWTIRYSWHCWQGLWLFHYYLQRRVILFCGDSRPVRILECRRGWQFICLFIFFWKRLHFLVFIDWCWDPWFWFVLSFRCRSSRQRWGSCWGTWFCWHREWFIFLELWFRGLPISWVRDHRRILFGRGWPIWWSRCYFCRCCCRNLVLWIFNRDSWSFVGSWWVGDRRVSF